MSTPHPITRAELLLFMRSERYAVQGSVSAAGGPQAAVIGLIVTDDFEVFFDSLDTSRKVQNLRRDRRIALVIGGMNGGERTVQYEGVTDEPAGAELDRLKNLYFERFPDGRDRERWPGITYIRARPIWIRVSNFAAEPSETLEVDAAWLGAERAVYAERFRT